MVGKETNSRFLSDSEKCDFTWRLFMECKQIIITIPLNTRQTIKSGWCHFRWADQPAICVVYDKALPRMGMFVSSCQKCDDACVGTQVSSTQGCGWIWTGSSFSTVSSCSPAVSQSFTLLKLNLYRLLTFFFLCSQTRCSLDNICNLVPPTNAQHR